MTTINFGKYRGQHIENIAKKDPSYLAWMQTTDISAEIQKIVADALAKATSAMPSVDDVVLSEIEEIELCFSVRGGGSMRDGVSRARRIEKSDSILAPKMRQLGTKNNTSGSGRSGLVTWILDDAEVQVLELEFTQGSIANQKKSSIYVKVIKGTAWYEIEGGKMAAYVVAYSI
jgi:hypothetical protein